jgi:hypothetical protein
VSDERPRSWTAISYAEVLAILAANYDMDATIDFHTEPCTCEPCTCEPVSVTLRTLLARHQA